MVKIDESKCNGCNLCYEVCIEGPILKGPRIKKTGSICFECGHCYAICPEDAIILEGFEDVETAELADQPAVRVDAMMGLLKGRRSGRMYKPKPVSREHVRQLVEAASLAPSADNAHPVKAYVYYDEGLIDEIGKKTRGYYRYLLRLFNAPGFPVAWRLSGLKPEELARLKYVFASLLNPSKREDILTYGAKTLLVFTAPRFNTMAVGDAWIAAQNAVNCAETIGVSTCYNGYIIMAAAHTRSLRRVMGIPSREKVVAVLTLGYPKRRFGREAPRRCMEIIWH